MIEKLERPTRVDADKIEALKALFPSAVSDGRINFDALREELSDDLTDVDSGDEPYGLYWSGKRKAKRIAAMPATGTLIPASGEGVDEDTTSVPDKSLRAGAIVWIDSVNGSLHGKSATSQPIESTLHAASKMGLLPR